MFGFCTLQRVSPDLLVDSIGTVQHCAFTCLEVLLSRSLPASDDAAAALPSAVYGRVDRYIVGGGGLRYKTSDHHSIADR